MATVTRMDSDAETAPVRVTWAVRLLYAVLGIEVLRTAFNAFPILVNHRTPAPTLSPRFGWMNNIPLILGILLVLLTFSILFIMQINRGRNWARYLFGALFVVALSWDWILL